MEPLSIVAAITAAIPFVTAGIKRLFGTKDLPDDYRSGIHALIPLILGILSTGLYTYSQTKNVWAAVAAGLGSGGAASSVRDVDRNLTRIVESVYKLVDKDAK